MSSCRLVRAVCKKETNQKVKALREELELKEKDIEEKDTKLNTLLQDPFGVIKLLATNYFNLRRSIEEPSNVRTRQFDDQLEQLSEEQLEQLSEIKTLLIDLGYDINIETCYEKNPESSDAFVDCCVNTYIANNTEEVEFITTNENDTLTNSIVNEKISKDKTKFYSVSIEGYKTIEKNAFYEYKNLIALDIRKSVKIIGYRAFGMCYELRKLVIGNSVETIDEYAFYKCTGLKEKLVIPNSVVSIGKYAFAYCAALKELVIGNSVETIGYRTFYECTGLRETLVIPNSVVSIGYVEIEREEEYDSDEEEEEGEVFSRCIGLKKIVIGNSLEKIGKLTFNFCSQINPVVISDATAKKLNRTWSSPGTVSSFYGSSNYGSSKPVEFILPEV